MAMIGRTELGMKATGRKCTVPDNPKANLMYYLNCMCTVLKLDDEDEIKRLTNYDRYWSLSDSDTDLLIMMCLAMKPDVLLNKCIFKNDAMCGDSSNEFYEIEAVRNNLLIAGSVMIGGRTKRVSKIMTFKMSWLQNHWIDPMKELIEEQERKRARSAAARRRQDESSCVVM